MTVPDPLDRLWPDRIGDEQGRQQHGEGDKDRLDPQQLGAQDLARQRVREIGRHRRLPLIVIALPPSTQHRSSWSFRHGRRTRPQVRNCAPGNLEIPGSMLRIAPE